LSPGVKSNPLRGRGGRAVVVPLDRRNLARAYDVGIPLLGVVVEEQMIVALPSLLG
jgi:hypothetical protein